MSGSKFGFDPELRSIFFLCVTKLSFEIISSQNLSDLFATGSRKDVHISHSVFNCVDIYHTYYRPKSDLSFKLMFNCMTMYVYLGVCGYTMCRQCTQRTEDGFGSSGAEIRKVVFCQLWVQGNKPQPSVRGKHI